MYIFMEKLRKKNTLFEKLSDKGRAMQSDHIKHYTLNTYRYIRFYYNILLQTSAFYKKFLFKAAIAADKGHFTTKKQLVFITKTYLYNFDQGLKPHFYTVKLGFTGVYINFLISAQKQTVDIH